MIGFENNPVCAQIAYFWRRLSIKNINQICYYFELKQLYCWAWFTIGIYRMQLIFLDSLRDHTVFILMKNVSLKNTPRRSHTLAAAITEPRAPLARTPAQLSWKACIVHRSWTYFCFSRGQKSQLLFLYPNFKIQFIYWKHGFVM